MKKLFLAILFLFSLTFVAKACFPEFPRKIAKVDGVCYAYDAGRWYVAGFEQEQDSIVLKSEVFIDGKKETVEDIYIRKYNNAHDFSSASPRVLVISKGFKTIAMLDLPKLEKLYISKTVDRTHDVCTSMYACFYTPNLKTIIVDKQNKELKSENGILFTKDGAYLLKYPAKKEGKEYSIPDNMEFICYGAFAHCELETVYYSKQKKGIESYEQFGVYDTHDEAAESMGFDIGKTKFIVK
ncbi:MAG: hypothetical protein IKK68_04115 [Paludibacteraceae bacterium]|nr:hypothetical protein [Paludibacteraceae bacterium]